MISKYKKIRSNFEKKYGVSTFSMTEKIKISKIFRDDKRLKVLWSNMMTRCYSPSVNNPFKYYGGKGIKVKMTKIDFLYLWNRDKAYLMKKPSIHRAYNNKHYEIGNCAFIEWENHNRGRSSAKQADLKGVIFRLPIKEYQNFKVKCICLGKPQQEILCNIVAKWMKGRRK